MTTTTEMPVKTVRTSAGLRDALFDELDQLRAGNSNPAKANAVAKLSDQVIATVKMELDVQKHIAKYKPAGLAPQLGAPVELGHKLWPDQEQDPDRTGKGWDVQVMGAGE